MPTKKAAPKAVDIDKLIEELLIGRHDERLSDLFSAFRHRVSELGGATRWRLTWDDLVVDEENLTLLECETAERLSGKTWVSLTPQVAAHDCAAILSSALMHRRGVTAAEARDTIAGLTVKQIADEVLSEYLAVPAPFDSATSTPM
jgi:hypothetical protein